MHRILALIERDLRKLLGSPTLIVVSMFFPLVQLVVLGSAFGGKIKELRVGVVDQDHGIPTVRLREMFGAIGANARTFVTVDYADQQRALTDLRNGQINGVLNIPPDFSRRVLAQAAPQVALIEDNTDNFSVAALGGLFSELVASYNQKGAAPRVSSGVTLSVVGATVVELLWADRGLGFLINFARGALDTPLMFAAVATLAGMALSLYVIVVLLEHLIIRWRKPSP